MKKSVTSKITSLPDDGERMVPSIHKGKLMYAEHLGRYQVAVNIVKDKVVLDIASGSGYGTKILSGTAKKVYGVDVSNEAVKYSESYFSAENIEYILGDGESIPLEDSSVDIVVTYETIEHIKDYEIFLDEVSRVLKDNGTAVVSTPNDLEFAEGNHFHLHEFTEEELTALLKKRFKYVSKYYQATWKSVGIGDSKFFSTEGKISASIENLSPVSSKEYLYFFFLCSNKPIDHKIEPNIIIGEHYSDRIVTETNNELIRLNELLVREAKTIKQLQAEQNKLQVELNKLEVELNNIYNSKSWRITRPIRKIKKLMS